ncbi:MAG: methyltransferase domain-containing protein, partial [Burkholderiales bacterium]
LDDEGVLLFSTLITDDDIIAGQPLRWWYASPRNGHISLYTRESLAILGAREGFKFASFSANSHAYWRRVPAWARGILPADTG